MYIYIYTHVDGTEMRVWRNEQSDEGIYGPRRLREVQHVAEKITRSEKEEARKRKEWKEERHGVAGIRQLRLISRSAARGIEFQSS